MWVWQRRLSICCWTDQWMPVIADGYELTFRSPKDESPPIIEYDESSFAHVVLFASETKSKYLFFCASYYLKRIFVFLWQASPMTLLPSLWFISLTSKATSSLRCQRDKLCYRPWPLSFPWFSHLLEPLSSLTSPNVTNPQDSSPFRLHLKIRLRIFWARACHLCGFQAYLCRSAITRS